MFLSLSSSPMNLVSSKALLVIPPMPRSISSIVVVVGGLAVFLTLASWVLISNPVQHMSRVEVIFSNGNRTRNLVHEEESVRKELQDAVDEKIPSESGGSSSLPLHPPANLLDSKSPKVDSSPEGEHVNEFEPNRAQKKVEVDKETLNGSGAVFVVPSGYSDSGFEVEVVPPAPVTAPVNKTKKVTVDSGSCDLFQGKWFYDQAGPLYTNNSCPVLTQMQNCQGNGRPDKDYENWRWKPAKCDLPRFGARKFLELMSGKTLAFIGDSVARNQMESLLCLLWQVEVPKNRGNRRMQRWFFKSSSATIVRIWSSWLVHKTDEAFQWAPQGVVKLHLDSPDEDFMEYLPKFDVVVISSGHWFAKQSVYVLNNEIVGGQLWWPDKSRQMKVDNVEAFGISVETCLSAMATHPNYTGLTIVRSFSPDHYEGGAWNTGGSCTGKVRPVEGKLVKNMFTEVMHEKQVAGFERAIKKATNKSKLRLLDITEAFEYRHDGHPGPYRSPDPNKKTQRGSNGEPPPQDCLHWCMPGPVDTWNEFVLEIIRREFEGS